VTAPEPVLDGDAERTRLASERTYLAWVRTGIACLAAAVAVGRVLPEVIKGSTAWPYVVDGVLWGLLGLALIGYGILRHLQVAEAARRGGGYPAPTDRPLIAVATIAGVVGLFSIVLLAVAP